MIGGVRRFQLQKRLSSASPVRRVSPEKCVADHTPVAKKPKAKKRKAKK